MPKWWASSWITVIATSSTTVVLGVADLEQTAPEDSDRVRQRAGVGGVTFGQRDALVEAE